MFNAALCAAAASTCVDYNIANCTTTVTNVARCNAVVCSSSVTVRWWPHSLQHFGLPFHLLHPHLSYRIQCHQLYHKTSAATPHPRLPRHHVCSTNLPQARPPLTTAAQSSPLLLPPPLPPTSPPAPLFASPARSSVSTPTTTTTCHLPHRIYCHQFYHKAPLLLRIRGV